MRWARALLRGQLVGGLVALQAAAWAAPRVAALPANPALIINAAEAGCPRRRDLVGAIEARLPGITRMGGGSGTVRRLEVERGEGPGRVILRLFVEGGPLVLERKLETEGARAGGERARPEQGCEALAEAAALVIERYLREMGYRPPSASVPAPPEPAPRAPAPAATTPSSDTPEAAAPVEAAPAPPEPARPPAESAVAAATETSPRPVSPASTDVTAAAPRSQSSSATGSLYLGLAGGLRLAPTGRGEDIGIGRGEGLLALRFGHRAITFELSGGLGAPTTLPIDGAPGAELRLRAMPLRAGVGVPFRVGAGTLDVQLVMSGEWLRFAASGLADARAGWRFDPAGEGGLAYLVDLGPVYLRPAAAGGVTLAPRDFDAGVGPPVYRTPTAYFRAQLEVGIALWKNSAR